jgi:hypothetical protein
MFGIGDAVAAGIKVLDKFVADPDAKIKAEAELRNALFALDAKQAEINTAEASNPNVFVSGWRPAIGWIGAGGLAYHFILRPIFVGLGWTSLPTLDGMLFELIFAMLGFGGLRTYEKLKGVAAK